MCFNVLMASYSFIGLGRFQKLNFSQLSQWSHQWINKSTVSVVSTSTNAIVLMVPMIRIFKPFMIVITFYLSRSLNLLIFTPFIHFILLSLRSLRCRLEIGKTVTNGSTTSGISIIYNRYIHYLQQVYPLSTTGISNIHIRYIKTR